MTDLPKCPYCDRNMLPIDVYSRHVLLCECRPLETKIRDKIEREKQWLEKAKIETQLDFFKPTP